MVKGWSELKSLAPFSWDTRVDDHPPGEAAMRDFSDAYVYASSAERPRRSTGQYSQTPTPLIKRKRTSASAGKEARTLSQKKVARPGQDKENRQTPSTAYVSSRLGLTSPALQTPSHAGTADLEDPTASNAKPSCDNAHAASTLAKGSISGYTLPFTHDEAHGTPSSAVASVPPCTGVAGAPAAAAPAAETALPAGVFGDRRLSSPEGPTHSIAQEGGSNPYDLAKEQQATAPQTREAEAMQTAPPMGCNLAPNCSKQMVSEVVESQSGAASIDAETSCGANHTAQLVQSEASPMTLSPDQIRQLAPAGPARDPSPSPHCRDPPLQPTSLATHECPTPVGVNAHACSTAQAASVEQMHHPSQQTEGPVESQICSRLAAAAPAAMTCSAPTPLSEAPTQEGSQQQRQQQLGQPSTSAASARQPHGGLELQKQALQAQVRCQVAVPQLLSASGVPQTAAATSEHARPDAVLHCVADAVLPAPSRASPRAQTAEVPSSRAPQKGQAAEAAPQQDSQATPSRATPLAQVAEAPSSRAPPRGQAAEAAPQQGSQATPSRATPLAQIAEAPSSRAPPKGQAAEAAPQQGSQATPSRATPLAQIAEAPSSRAPPRGQAAEAAPQQGSQATPSRATPLAQIAEAPSSRAPPRGQAAEAAPQQGSQATPSRALARGQAAEAALQQASQATPSRAPPRGQAAEAAPRQGPQTRHAQAVTSRSCRNVLRDRNASGTRMSLRSRNRAPDKAIRKASSSSRSGRIRSALEVRAPAYATRSRSSVLSESEASQRRHEQQNRHRHAGSSSSSSRAQHTSKASHQPACRAGFAAGASSSDLAAAQALAELRHEDESDTDSLVSGEEEPEEEERQGDSSGAGYDRGFRVSAPPLPLWLPDGATAAGAGVRECPPLFRPTACTSATQDWSIGTATPALQVLPRHRQSAAAAAEAILKNPSPLSGLHKLALSICARKRSIPMQPFGSMPAGGAAEGQAGGAAHGKENVTPPPQWQQADASGGTDNIGRANTAEVAQEQTNQMKTQQGWDRYVAAQLCGTKGSACQAKLVSAIEAELAQPGLGLLARACLLLRLDDAKAGLLYSQYHGILAFCTAQHQV